MKKKILFSLMALFMLSLTFTSCGDDDDDDNNGATIVGKWKEVSYVWYEDGGNTPLTDDKYTSDTVLEFKGDGTGSASDKYGSSTFKWTLSGSRLKITYDDGEDETEEGNISINGNTLIISDEYDEEDGHHYKDVYTYTRQ